MSEILTIKALLTKWHVNYLLEFMKQFEPRVRVARSKAENEKGEGEKIIDF